MSEKPSCACGTAPKLIYPCSGSADVGALADLAARQLAEPATDLVVLDEMTYAFKYGWLDLPAVLAAFAARPRHQHVIVTGRAAPAALIEAADTVTEMGMVKHAFQAGVPAMPGLEW